MSDTAKAYLHNDKYIKVDVECKSSDILKCLQKKNICTAIPKKMLERIDNFLRFINTLNDNGTICIKKDPDNEDTFISLGFNIIIIVNIEGWVSAIKEAINNQIFGAPSSVYEMLSRLGFSPMGGESSSGSLYSDIKSRKSRLTFLKDIWVYSDDKTFTNMHRLWNSNISGVDTIRTNVIYKKTSINSSDDNGGSGGSGDSGGSGGSGSGGSSSNAKRQKTEKPEKTEKTEKKEPADTSNLQLLCNLV